MAVTIVLHPNMGREDGARNCVKNRMARSLAKEWLLFFKATQRFDGFFAMRANQFDFLGQFDFGVA